MKKYGFKKFNNGWHFKIGGTSGESFKISLRYFNANAYEKGFRLSINLNTDRLIKIFGFNQRNYGI